MFQDRETVKAYEQLLAQARQSGDQEVELESLLGLAAALYEIALDEPAFASESFTQYKQAFTLASELGHKRGMVQSLIATTWFTDFWPDYWDRAIADIERACAISQEAEDDDLVFDCMIAKANKDLVSIEEVELLLSQLESRHDLPRVKAAFFRLNWRHLLAGNFVKCVEGCETSIALATKLGISPVMYSTIKALALLDLGRYDAAREALQQEIADERYRFGRALKEFGEGTRFLELMAYGRAGNVFARVIEQATQLERAWLRRWAEAGLSICLLRSGRLDELNLDWTNQDSATNASAIPVAAPQLLGEIALYQGALDEALRQAKKAAAEAESRGWEPSHVAALELQMRVLFRLDRPADVIPMADKGIRMAAEMEYRPMLWRVRSAKAQALAVLGVTRAAAEEHHAAVAVVRALASTIDDGQLRRGFLSKAGVSLCPN